MTMKTYPAHTPYEARAQLRNLEHDQVRRLIDEKSYLHERRRLVRLALGPPATWWLRGGPNHDYPCRNPSTTECALEECQMAGKCQMRQMEVAQ